MPKPSMSQDVVQKRSIRDIPVNHEGGHKHRVRRKRSGRKFHMWMWLVVVVAVGFLIFSFGLVFSGATVVVVPKSEEVRVNASVVLSATTEDENSIKYETLRLSTISETIELEADGEEYVEEAASGMLTIYNDTTVEQRLIKNTRFESPKGLIYRIRNSVDVPGGDGKNPGTLNVKVYADEAGSLYNIGPTDFTIPGFKGTAKFDLFYAKSTGEMTGGYEGKVKSVSKGKLEASEVNLRESLSAKVIDEINLKKGEQFVTIPDLVFIDFDTEIDRTGSSKVKIVGKASAVAAIVDIQMLSKAVARTTITAYDDAPVMISDIESLNISSLDQSDLVVGKDNIAFDLSGNTVITWLFDEEELKADLAGKSRKNLASVLSDNQSIQSLDVLLRPFWKLSFPNNQDKINIESDFKL